MPVEIKELVIRAVYDKKRPGAPVAAPRVQATASNDLSLVETCVEQVLEILEKRHKR